MRFFSELAWPLHVFIVPKRDIDKGVQRVYTVSRRMVVYSNGRLHMADVDGVIEAIIESRKASISTLEVQVKDLEDMASDVKRTPAARSVFRAQAKVKRQRLTRLRKELEALLSPSFDVIAQSPSVRKGG